MGLIAFTGDEAVAAIGPQTLGMATTQVAAASGQIYFSANIYTQLATSFLAFTGGSGRSHIDKLSDCVQRYDPANLVAKGLALAHEPLRKKWFGHPETSLRGGKPGFWNLKQGNYRLTTWASELGHKYFGTAAEAARKGKGWAARGLRSFGRAASWASTGYGLLLGVAELGCEGAVLLGFDPGK